MWSKLCEFVSANFRQFIHTVACDIHAFSTACLPPLALNLRFFLMSKVCENVKANRMYNCAACHSLVIICSGCDRGNIYCQSCAPEMQKQRRRDASRRYQSTFKGKLNHARRQKNYRLRKEAKKVTHKGSREVYRCVLIAKSSEIRPSLQIPINGFSKRDRPCHFCCKSPTRFLRSTTCKTPQASIKLG